MKSQNTKSSDELHQEVRAELRNVRNDIDQLQGRLSPGQLIDDVIFYPHGQNPSATIDHLKRNPVGTAFLSLGTLMLMEDDSHQSMEANARAKLVEARTKLSDMKERVKNQLPHKELEPGSAPNMADIAKGRVNNMKDSFQAKVAEIKQGLDEKIPSREEIKSRFHSKSSGLKEDVSNRIDSLREKLPDTEEIKTQFSNVTDRFPDSEDIKAKVGEFTDRFQSSDEDTVSTESTDFSGTASSTYQKATSKLSSTFEVGKEKIRDLDPMTYMALGAGLGAITGAALPISEAEQRMVDEKLQTRLTSFNQELHEAVSECTSILKDLVINDVKNFSSKMF